MSRRKNNSKSDIKKIVECNYFDDFSGECEKFFEDYDKQLCEYCDENGICQKVQLKTLWEAQAELEENESYRLSEEQKNELVQKINNLKILHESSKEQRKEKNATNKNACKQLAEWIYILRGWNINGKALEVQDKIVEVLYIDIYHFSNVKFMDALKNQKKRWKYYDVNALLKTTEKAYKSFDASREGQFNTYFSRSYEINLPEHLMNGRYMAAGITIEEKDENGEYHYTKDRNSAVKYDEEIKENKLSGKSRFEKIYTITKKTKIDPKIVNLLAYYDSSDGYSILDTDTDESENKGRSLESIIPNRDSSAEDIIERKESEAENAAKQNSVNMTDGNKIMATYILIKYRGKGCNDDKFEQNVHKGFAAWFYGVPEEKISLDFICDNPKKITQKNISEYMMVSGSAVSQGMSKLFEIYGIDKYN